MKTKTIIGALLLTMLVTVSACKREFTNEASIERDCTGTYLSILYTRYKVCNPEKIANISAGTAVEVSFKKLRKCDGSGDFSPTCELYHHFDAWAEITDIK
jgi:hypothetical protein